MNPILRILMVIGFGAMGSQAMAQGQDSTTAERDIMVLAEMLPGVFDSQEQVYFDGRTGAPKEAKHERMNSKIVRVDLPAFGPYVFFVQDAMKNKLDEPSRVRLYALSVDKAINAVRMRMYFLDTGDNKTKYVNAQLNPSVLADLKPETTFFEKTCDVIWRREAGQFHGATPSTCKWSRPGEKKKFSSDYQIQLTNNSLWVRDIVTDSAGKLVSGPVDGVFYKMNRARAFMCHADMPGVSGGRDIPFKRHGPFQMTDQGGQVSFMSEEKEPREVNILLRNVDWQVNNETGAFTRDVLVTYVYEKKKDGTIGQSAYSFTEPTVRRTGINLGWILVLCYMESNREGKAEF